MAIKKYKIGHTIPNTYPGGFKGALFREKYQLSICALEREAPTKVMMTKIGSIIFCN